MVLQDRSNAFSRRDVYECNAIAKNLLLNDPLILFKAGLLENTYRLLESPELLAGCISRVFSEITLDEDEVACARKALRLGGIIHEKQSAGEPKTLPPELEGSYK